MDSEFQTIFVKRCIFLLLQEDESGKTKDFEKKKTQEQNRVTVLIVSSFM